MELFAEGVRYRYMLGQIVSTMHPVETGWRTAPYANWNVFSFSRE